jgi:hypothetical protein
MTTRKESHPERVALYTVGDAAKVLKESTSTTRNRFDRGELPGLRASDGQRLLYPEPVHAAARAR